MSSKHSDRGAMSRHGKAGAGVVVLIVLICLGVVGGSTWMAKRSQMLAEEQVNLAREQAARAAAEAETTARESLKLADQLQPPAEAIPSTLDQAKAPAPVPGAIDAAAIRFGSKARARRADAVRLARKSCPSCFAVSKLVLRPWIQGSTR